MRQKRLLLLVEHPKPSLLARATKRFERIECATAEGMLHAMLEQDKNNQKKKHANDNASGGGGRAKKILVRSLQIGSVGLVVGGIFALTGGLAAPGLVAAISAFGIGTGSAAFATLTTTTALMTMFGVTGGGMAAYKMKKRTDQVTEWRIRNETHRKGKKGSPVVVRGLHATVSVSGWLLDKCDFQRPWGVMANDPPIKDKLEVLQRYFAFYGPEKMIFAKSLLRANKKKEKELWHALAMKYGTDPDHLVPFRQEHDFVVDPEMLKSIITVLATQVLPDDAAQKLDETYQSNTMLVQMEAMNDEILGSTTTTTREEASLPEESTHSEESSSSSSSLDSPRADGENSKDSTEKQEAKTASLSTREEDEEALLAKMEAMNAQLSSFSSDSSSNLEELSRRANDNSVKDRCVSASTTEADDDDEDSTVDESSVSDDDDVAAATSKGAVELLKELEDKSSSSSSVTTTTSATEDVGAVVKKDDFDMVIWDWEASFGGDLYTVTWETELLTKLCRVVNLLFVEIGTQVSRELAKQTIIGGVVAAVAIPSALMTASNVIDDPYQMISFRSDYAGVELAKCLLQSDEHRPVSLVGYSFGARVIFTCLLELAKHQQIWEQQQAKQQQDENDDDDAKKSSFQTRRRRRRQGRRRQEQDAEHYCYKREPASIVEDVVLMGMPRLLETTEWVTCREVVAGRLVNCFHKSDWFLSYLFQIRCWSGVSRWTAGTHPVLGVAGVENANVTEFVPTHGRYPLVVPQLLHHVGLGQPRLHHHHHHHHHDDDSNNNNEEEEEKDT